MLYKGFTIDDERIDKYVEKMEISIEEACIMILEEDGKIEEREEVKKATSVKEKKRHYEKSGKPRKKAEKVRKVDETKKHLIGCVKNLLIGMHAEVTEVKTETEIKFNYGGDSYTFKLTKHRPPKQREPA
jgi:hypothetical protein